MVERQVNDLTVRVVQGDICDRRVDAVVNAANNHLWMGGGVAGALKRRGGPEIEQEAVRQGPVAVGEAVATTAGKLPAKHVIHAAVMGQDLVTGAEAIRRATMSALAHAEEMGLASIAFPALGTGVGGFPLQECARIMLATVAATPLQSVTSVEFVLFDQAAYDAFSAELRELR
jgi:O-acetyl-ADP-ribose deacetylase